MPPGIHRLERVGSTLDFLHELAARGAEEGTAVVAEEQIAGRGTRGRSWHSPRGGLWLSRLCRPVAPLGVQILSLRVGIAIAEALGQLSGIPPIGLKWPNDILLGGRKVGGILCEARWHGDELAWVAIGVGLNVSNPIPPELLGTAARLGDYRPDLTPAHLLGPVLAQLSRVETGIPVLTSAELALFERYDWLNGKELLEPEPGAAAGIRPDGALLVRAASGAIVPVRAGHVVLARTV